MMELKGMLAPLLLKDKKFKDQWLPGVQNKGGMNRWSTEDFQGGEKTLCDALVAGICPYTLVKTHRM